MKYTNLNKQVGSTFILILLLFLVVAVISFGAYTVYTNNHNGVFDNSNNSSTDEINLSSIESVDNSAQDSEYTPTINDGTLEIADTNLVIEYPKDEWIASTEDELYDYVLASNNDFRLSVDVLEPDEGGKGCGDCVYEPIEQMVTIDGKKLYLTVAGGYSSANNLASNVTLSASPDKLILPTLSDGKQLFYQLVYFPGAPDVTSVFSGDFQSAVAVMATISE